MSLTEASESAFIFTSEAFYFLCVCSLGLFRDDIVSATCRGWWHCSCQPQSKDALEGHLWHPGQDNELSTPSPSPAQPRGHHQEGQEPSNTLCTLSPLSHPEGAKVSRQAQTKAVLPPCRADSSMTPGGSPDSSWASQPPKLELRVLLTSLSSPEQGEGSVTAAQLFTPGREFLCQWFQYQTAEQCLVCGWKAALLLF